MVVAAPPEGIELDELVARVESAAEGAVRAIDVHERFGATAEENETPAAAIGAAFLYAETNGRHGRRGLKEFFIPIGEFGDFVSPPHIKDMPTWVTDTWDLCAGRVTTAVAGARLHDLCFVAAVGNNLDHIRKAVTAYIEVSDRYLNDDGNETAPDLTRLHVALSATHALARAHELARAAKQSDLLRLASQKLVAASRKALDTDAGPGVVLGFIDPLAHDPAPPNELDELLTRARALYQDDLWNSLSTIELQLSRAGVSDAAKQQLYREQVEAYLKAAEVALPMNAMTHRRDAASLALTHHITDLYEQAVSELQAMRGQDIGMVKRKVEISIPAEIVEQFIGQFVNAPSWQEGLAGLVSISPPCGQLEANLAQVAELPRIAPLASRIPVTQIGLDGLPRMTSATEEERNAYHLADAEMRHMQVFGGMYVEALRQIGERWDLIDKQELAAFIGQHSHVAPETASALARGFLRFFDGDHEAATFTVVPRIERIARDLLLQMGAVIFRPAQGASVGTYSGLGVLLQMLDDRGLDPSWSRFLGTLLTRAEGSSFRNNLLHGAVDDPSVGSAGLSLIAALYLAVAINV